MTRHRLTLKYCYGCGFVRVELADVTHCPVCKTAHEFTKLEVETIDAGGFIHPGEFAVHLKESSVAKTITITGPPRSRP